MWYGLEMGLTYDQAMDLPISIIYDLISINQIKKEGYRYKQSVAEGQLEFLQMAKLLK